MYEWITRNSIKIEAEIYLCAIYSRFTPFQQVDERFTSYISIERIENNA